MSWYKTGTITVNNGSASVTGSGTAWIVNAAAGEGIYLPDGSFKEIDSVNSDTSITLASAYTGTSLSGQSYTILPSQSFIRDLAAQAAALINSYASIANNAGAGKFGDGTLGAPGISFTNDTNTGIRRTADGTFRLVSNGVDVAEIAPGGITLLSPDGTKSLAVTNSGTTVTGPLSAGATTVTSLTAAGSVTATVTGNAFVADRAGANGSSEWRYNGATRGMIQAGDTAGLKFYDSVAGQFIGTWSYSSGLFVSGNVLVGATTAAKRLTVNGSIYPIGASSGGAIYCASGATGTTNHFADRGEDGGDGFYHRFIHTAGGGWWGYRSEYVNDGGTPNTYFTPYNYYRNGALKFNVNYDGNVTNVNNSYGAISDPDRKMAVELAGSQVADVKALARIVVKYNLTADPDGPRQIGFLSRDGHGLGGVKAISPGLVFSTDGYEEVVVEPARTEVKIVQRPKMQKVTVEQPTPTLVDGRYVLRMVLTEVDVPVIEEHPLFAEDGSAIIKVIEPEQPEQRDEAGNIVVPAKPAVLRQAVHRVSAMEDVEETVEIPAKIERRPTGTQTEGVHYSIAYMKAFKALGEALEMIEAQALAIARLESDVATLKGV